LEGERERQRIVRMLKVVVNIIDCKICVCVCVCVRARARACACVYERERERECVRVCVCTYIKSYRLCVYIYTCCIVCTYAM